MQERFRRRRLPHWDLPGATYFVTTCLAGSTPAAGLLDIAQYRESLDNRAEWEFSSAHDRIKWGIGTGRPLLRLNV